MSYMQNIYAMQNSTLTQSLLQESTNKQYLILSVSEMSKIG